MKVFICAVFLLINTAYSYPLSPHEIYGKSSGAYIREYYSRILSFVVTHHPQIKKCVDLAAVKKRLSEITDWGSIVDVENNILAPHLEVSYQRSSRTQYFIVLKVSSKSSSNWGLQYSINQNGLCQQKILKEYYTAGYSFILKDHLFSSIVSKSYQDILFLKAFSLTYISAPLRNWALLHQRELNQLTYKLSWKNENEYTLYYP